MIKAEILLFPKMAITPNRQLTLSLEPKGYTDLNRRLIANPQNTFGIYMKGLGMLSAGIYPDSLLIVDSSEVVSDGDIAVAYSVGHSDCLAIGQLKLCGSRILLVPADEDLEPSETRRDLICGKVMHSILSFGGKHHE